MSEGPSLFPLREMLLICNGCGGERQVPDTELAKILSVDDFDKFIKSGRIADFACMCGKQPRTCDIRMLPSAAASEVMKKSDDT